MQISLAAQQIRSIAHIWVVTHHQYGISALIPHVENIENVGGPKCWLFTRATSNTPFDFHIFIHYLQVDNLSNTSTTKPTEENQANTEEEGNGTKKCKLSAQWHIL